MLLGDNTGGGGGRAAAGQVTVCWTGVPFIHLRM